jgi:hypothetical protein
LVATAYVRGARTEKKVGHSGPFVLALGWGDDRTEGAGPTKARGLALPRRAGLKDQRYIWECGETKEEERTHFFHSQ